MRRGHPRHERSSAPRGRTTSGQLARSSASTSASISSRSTCRYAPSWLLELDGQETVIDYGTGTARLAAAVADQLPRGRVIALEQQPAMLGHARERLISYHNAEVVAAEDDHTGLPDAAADRILAVNVLHEFTVPRALAEIRRLLAPGGHLLLIDWAHGRPRPYGPPDTILATPEQAVETLEAAGLHAFILDTSFPYHLTVRGIPR